MLCGLRADDACCFNDKIPNYLFFECPRGDYIDSFMTEDVSDARRWRVVESIGVSGGDQLHCRNKRVACQKHLVKVIRNQHSDVGHETALG